MKKPTVILDSGAYTAFRKGKTINIDEYADFIKRHGHLFAGCFNLDSIGSGMKESKDKSKDKDVITTAKQSFFNWMKLRKQGIDTIPIYHMGTNQVWLRKYLERTDYIGIGAIANLNTSQRLMGLSALWKKYFVDKEGNPIVKVHGLGLTAIPMMVRYPWYSVDSFTPVISAVWGSILLPKLNSEGEPSYFNMSINKVSDQGNHKYPGENSYLAVPKRNQKIYEQMFLDYGFELGQITYQEKHDRRGKAGEQARKPKPLFNLIRPSDPNVKTLANSWEIRMKWNLIMWNQLKERMPIYPRPFVDEDNYWKEKVTGKINWWMNMGVSTITHLDIFNSVKPKHDILISYAYMTDGIYDKIFKEYLK